ncbi:MAG: hypothetical protein MUQ10_15135, partial [Anaerolineae bacterium]|nr:hypothetical protein [Anaerolineae bacterium]
MVERCLLARQGDDISAKTHGGVHETVGIDYMLTKCQLLLSVRFCVTLAPLHFERARVPSLPTRLSDFRSLLQALDWDALTFQVE